MNKAYSISNIKITEKKNNLIPYGFTDIYGIEWPDCQVDLYNEVSEDIQQRKNEGFSVSEKMLNNRHRIYHVPLYGKKLNAEARI